MPSEMRRRAVFMIADKADDQEATELLLEAARNDPDEEVREQAVFWLSEVDDGGAVNALIEIVGGTGSVRIRERAVFALSQHDSRRARVALRELVARTDEVQRLREQAIFWLGNEGDQDDIRYLRDLYGQLESRELKRKVVFALAEAGGEENLRWLRDRAIDPTEDIELRKNALFWAGEAGLSMGDLVTIYDEVAEIEMREQLIFVLSQRDERAATDKLMHIASNDPSSRLRQRAIFWLGQSEDPRAVDFLLELIQRGGAAQDDQPNNSILRVGALLQRTGCPRAVDSQCDRGRAGGTSAHNVRGSRGRVRVGHQPFNPKFQLAAHR